MGFGLGGSFFGDSDASQKTTNTTKSNTVNPSVVAGDNLQEQTVLTAGGDSNYLVSPNSSSQNFAGVTGNITTGDYGAIKQSYDFALESAKNIQNTAEQAIAASQSSTSSAYQLANAARQSDTSNNLQNLIQYGVYVILAGIAAYAYVKTQG